MVAASGELNKFGFIHLATHGVVDEAVPTRSAVIQSQTDLPDPPQQIAVDINLVRSSAILLHMLPMSAQRGYNVNQSRR